MGSPGLVDTQLCRDPGCRDGAPEEEGLGRDAPLFQAAPHNFGLECKRLIFSEGIWGARQSLCQPPCTGEEAKAPCLQCLAKPQQGWGSNPDSHPRATQGNSIYWLCPLFPALAHTAAHLQVATVLGHHPARIFKSSAPLAAYLGLFPVSYAALKNSVCAS